MGKTERKLPEPLHIGLCMREAFDRWKSTVDKRGEVVELREGFRWAYVVCQQLAGCEVIHHGYILSGETSASVIIGERANGAWHAYLEAANNENVEFNPSDAFVSGYMISFWHNHGQPQANAIRVEIEALKRQRDMNSKAKT